eukprot:3573604-Heterocapsa_arctica.AAC.1
MSVLPIRFPLQKLNEVPLAKVEAVIEEADNDNLAAIAGDRQAAEHLLLDDIFGAPGWGDSEQEDAPDQGSHAACSAGPLPPD